MPGRAGPAARADDTGEERLRTGGAPAEVEHDLLLLTEEACVNVMRHAYPPGAPGSITLQVRVLHHGDTNGIELTLEDQGRPFDPLAMPAVDVGAAAEDRAVGGLGVHLIRQLADRLDYRRDPLRGNVFTIEKFLPATHPSDNSF